MRHTSGRNPSLRAGGAAPAGREWRIGSAAAAPGSHRPFPSDQLSRGRQSATFAGFSSLMRLHPAGYQFNPARRSPDSSGGPPPEGSRPPRWCGGEAAGRRGRVSAPTEAARRPALSSRPMFTQTAKWQQQSATPTSSRCLLGIMKMCSPHLCPARPGPVSLTPYPMIVPRNYRIDESPNR